MEWSWNSSCMHGNGISLSKFDHMAEAKYALKRVDWKPLDPPNGNTVQEVGYRNGRRVIRTYIIVPEGSSYFEEKCGSCPSCKCREKTSQNKADAKRSNKRREDADPAERSARDRANYDQNVESWRTSSNFRLTLDRTRSKFYTRRRPRRRGSTPRVRQRSSTCNWKRNSGNGSLLVGRARWLCRTLLWPLLSDCSQLDNYQIFYGFQNSAVRVRFVVGGYPHRSPGRRS